MKAITYSRYGPPGVLTLSDVERPVPGDDDILVRVRAAEATKADCELRSFRFAVRWFWLPLRLAVGITRPRRRILGGYFAGEVADVGRNVDRFRAGDAVFGAAGLRMGAYGEYMSLPADATLTAKPANMSFAEAAAVPLGGLNALHFMRLANVRPGEQVLINGAGGSIGAHAVQIAKHLGGQVTAVDCARKADFLRRLGADHVIDYETEKISAAGRLYDVMFDMVPGNPFGPAMRLLTEDGRYFSGNPSVSVMLRAPLASRLTNRTASFAFARETSEELEALRELIEAGAIRPIVDRVLPMEQAAEAHRLVETEERIGAVVIATG